MSERIDIRSTITDMLRHRPLNPFTIVTASGDRLDVREPHAAAINDTQMIVLRNGINVIKLNQVRPVASIEPDYVGF
jgi:hypothetical protein